MSETNPETAGESRLERVDRLYDVLKHGRRRRILRALLEHQTMALADLAEMLAEGEHDAGFTDIPKEAVLRAYASLHHCHLPKLDDADLVLYDEETELVTLPSPERRAHAETLLSIAAPRIESR